MDYTEEFKTKCKQLLTNSDIPISNSSSTAQRKYEFERELNLKIEELNNYFNEQADKWAILASQKGQLGIRPTLSNEIRTILREYKSLQIDRIESTEN